MTPIPNHAAITRASASGAITQALSNPATAAAVLTRAITGQSRESRAGAITPGGGSKNPPGVLGDLKQTSIAALIQGPCQRCGGPGVDFLEPRGTWCPSHVPSLWRVPERAWATPSCHRCGAPGAYPNRGITRPACRAHAPRWLARLLHTPTPERTPDHAR